MNENKSKKSLIIIILLVANLCISGFMAAYLFIPSAEPGGQIGFSEVKNGKYILSIGMNDKDTYEQIIETDKAIEIVNNICAENGCGYTMTEARGGWAEDDRLFHENTLVYTLVGATEEQAVAIMQAAREALNQNTILVEMEDSKSAYYGG